MGNTGVGYSLVLYGVSSTSIEKQQQGVEEKKKSKGYSQPHPAGAASLTLLRSTEVVPR